MQYDSKLSDYLDEAPELDGAVVFADGMHSVAHPSYFELLTGASPVAARNCLFVTADGRRVILTDLPRDVDRLRRHTDVTEVRSTPAFADDVASLLADLGLDGTTGLAGTDRMPMSLYRRFDDSVGELRHIDGDLKRLTVEKTDEILATFRELGRIADRGFQAAYDAVRPGATEVEIAAEVEGAMRAAGAEDNFNLFGSGPHNDLMHSPTDRVVREGDTFLCELSPMVEGFVLQICRTVAVGTPNATLRDRYVLLERALAETKRKLEAGVQASLVSETMNEVFRAEGYGEYCQPPYMRTRGHEFGVGDIGMAITEGTDVELTPGMVLVVHPNQYLPETGYLALGDPLLIREDGCETLTDTPPRLFTKEVLR
jgi:Xaa-Pro aminopeptidase